MKKKIEYFLQKLLGFSNYLYLFAIFRIYTLKFKKYERDIFVFMKLCGDNANIIDVGANIGVMTILLARKFKKGKIFSFEPIPQNFITLKKIVSLFKCKNVKIFNLALGDECNKLKMLMPVENGILMQGLSHVLINDKDFKKNGLLYEVEQKKLDGISELNGIPIKGIKIDAENYEYYVLKGAQNILVEHKPIIYCEIWNNNQRNRTFNFLSDLNYKAKIFDGKELVDYIPMKHHTDNFFFIYNN